MKLTLIIALALGVIETRPAANPDGRLLTMKEATIERTVYPTAPREVMEKLRGKAPGKSVYGQAKGQGVFMLDASDTLWIARDSADIHYGCSVSRNEFGISGGMFPSPGEDRLAFYRKDESLIGTFPLLDISTEYGSLISLKYPMNGTESERIALCVFDKATSKTVTLDVHDFGEDRYIAAVSWLTEDLITAQILSRSQHEMHLNLYSAVDGSFIRTILTESNDAWVEPYSPQIALSERLFLYFTDNRDGYKSIYLTDTDGGVKRLTEVPADTYFIEYQAPYLYYYSHEDSPAERKAYRIKLTLKDNAVRSRVGRPQCLTPERGSHSVDVREDCIIDRYSSFSNPGTWVKRSLDGKVLETLCQIEDPLEGFAVPEMEFGSVPSADGLYENHYRLLKPVGFDPEKQYPLVVYVYGGPHSQMVTDSWLGGIRMWEMLMAQKGYVVYVQDNRGTQNHGAAYEKAISRRCGQAEMEDQMVGIRRLLEESWIDSSRVGVHGWSYGGFMTISLAVTYPEVFKAAVAGGPVIDWKWYEIMYGERYMDTCQTNPEGFAETSLIGKAGQLGGSLLICQGAVDDTVVWQHSLSFLQECIREGKQVDYFPFPLAEHNMRGMERVYLYQKITDWFDAWL